METTTNHKSVKTPINIAHLIEFSDLFIQFISI